MEKSEKSNKKAVKAVPFALVLLIVLAPVFAYAASAHKVKGVYKNTFTAALRDKYDLLCKTDGAKIVVVGGSSVCFGSHQGLSRVHHEPGIQHSDQPNPHFPALEEAFPVFTSIRHCLCRQADRVGQWRKGHPAREARYAVSAVVRRISHPRETGSRH